MKELSTYIFSYDEADEDDNPAVVVGWIYNWLLYVLDIVN